MYRPASLLGRANIPYLYTVPSPWPVVSAAPTDGPRSSCHVFADGARGSIGDVVELGGSIGDVVELVELLCLAIL